MKVPEGGAGAPPQQASVPSVRTPHPPLTDTKVPEGGAGALPQQASVPSVRTPHECISAALTDANVPDGALD